MDFFEVLLCTILAYLIGGIPTAIWLGKIRYGIDIREHGSGSASHLNVQRIMGPRASYMVRALDVLKGFAAANLAFFIQSKYGLFSEHLAFPIVEMSLGLAAVMGHIFPVFAGFRGGKGVHVSLGVLLAVQPVATLAIGALTLIIFLLSRYPVLGYLVGALTLPIFVLATPGLQGDLRLPMLTFSVLIFGLLLYSHRENLHLILMGQEQRVPIHWR